MLAWIASNIASSEARLIAFAYAFDLAPGKSRVVSLLVPFHGAVARSIDPDAALEATRTYWRERHSQCQNEKRRPWAPFLLSGGGLSRYRRSAALLSCRLPMA